MAVISAFPGKNFTTGGLKNQFVNLATGTIPASHGRFYVRVKTLKFPGLSPIYPFCGGAQIHPYWVVTSALCLMGTNGAKITCEFSC